MGGTEPWESGGGSPHTISCAWGTDRHGRWVERGAGTPRRERWCEPGHAGTPGHSAAPRELGSFAGVAMAPCMSLGSPFTPCGPLRPAVVSGSNNSSRRQYRIKRSVRAAAAPRHDEGDAQRVAVSAVLGALFGSLAPKQDPSLAGEEPSPAGPKLGNVVGAVMAAFVLVRGPPGVGP